MTPRTRRPAALLLTAAVCTVAVAGPAAADTSAPAAWSGGWLRLAHFSPGTPPVDVYLYPFGGTGAALVLKHVAYGQASAYESVAVGEYTVAMRLAGARASVTPVISSTVDVRQGRAYTVAGLGPASALELQTLPDQLSAPSGQAGVRVIQASLTQPSITVDIADATQDKLRFPASTPYQTVPAGSTSVRVTVGSDTVARTVDLAGRTTHTLVLLSSTAAAPELIDLTDSTGPSTQPKGGVETGLGGDASANSDRSAVPQVAGWGAALILGSAVASISARRLRRTRA